MKMQNERPPIVVVMGHIDHGKTTLLDYMRKSNVAAKETGGITQHIGAYEVDHGGKNITFLDTPGHEAFSKMRSRGAAIADVAVLVVAADDSVKPQTKEALEAIKISKISYAVAINKIDKPAANLEKTKNDLAEAGVFLEGRGGNVPFVEISAKSGTGVDQLLETILLLAEMENLKYNPSLPAAGVVIESHRDSKRGVTSTLLLRDGILKKGEYVVSGAALSKVRILEDFRGQSVSEVKASSPAVVVGFDKLPLVGSVFSTHLLQKEAMDAQRKATELIGLKNKTVAPTFVGERLVLGILIKTDVLGSSEAILHEIDKLRSDACELKVLRAEAGDVTEDDIKFASSSEKVLVIAFRASVGKAAKELAERMQVEIKSFKIIYEVADFLKEKIKELAPPEIQVSTLGKAKIIKIFTVDKSKKIIGGKVLEGVLKNGARFNILRRENKIGEGRIENLQSGRINVSQVEAQGEFGAQVSSKTSIVEGDTLDIFE